MVAIVSLDYYSKIEDNKMVSRNAQYKDVHKKTIEFRLRAPIFQAICCLNADNAHLKLALPISG